MANIASSYFDISYLDALSYQTTLIHRLDPRIKLLTTLFFIVMVLSFGKYEVAALIPFVIYPVALVALANLPAGYLFSRMLLAAPFALLVGAFNPFLDRAVLVHLGPLELSGGWVSLGSIMVRFALTVSAALILIATSGFNGVCTALEKMGAPRILAVQLLFLYRYLFVLTEEASRLTRARSLRSFGGRGLGFKVYGNMIGQLLLRTLDRAKRIHQAMRCRGFDGEIRLMRPLKISGADLGFLFGWSGLFVLMRCYPIPQWIGRAVTGFFP